MKSTIILFCFLTLQLALFSQRDTTLTVYFDSNSAECSMLSRTEILSTMTSILENHDIIKTSIDGFCDDVASEGYNRKLSLKRALSLAEIVQFKMNSEDPEIIGRGEVQLIKNSGLITETQRRQNRKAEVTFTISTKVKAKTEATEPIEVKTPLVPSYLEGKLKVGDKIVLEGILFVGNRDLILAESLPHAKSLLNELKSHPHVSVQIQGHIYDPYYYDPDFKSPDSGNLSEKRAKKIYDYLINNGVDQSRLSYIGFEGKYPLGGDSKFDRRVEIEITNLD